MKAVFIESSEFTEWVSEFLLDDAYSALQQKLMDQPTMTAKRRKPLFARLKQGLEQGIAHVQGELTLRTVEVPDEPPEFDAKTLTALRARAAMSQAVFAKLLNVSTKTLQSWEQGLRQPSDASRRLIQVFREEPAMVCRIVGLREIDLRGVDVTQNASGHRKVVVRSPIRKKQLAGRRAQSG